MSWKNIIKREKLPLTPPEALFNIPTGNLNRPPESRYFENAKVHWMESVQFVGEELERRYIPSKAQIEDLRKPFRINNYEGDPTKKYTDEEVRSKVNAAKAAYTVASKAFQKVIDPYLEFMGSWDKKENLQAANKEWEYLTHRVMLMVHTGLNNLFPTVKDAYNSRKLNGFLHWKGEYYQNLMKETLVDTMEEIKPAKKQPPKKRDYMAERKRRIKEMRGGN